MPFKKEKLPDIVSALRATYKPLSLYWTLQREFGVSEEVQEEIINNRNFLSKLADSLSGNDRWRREWGGKWCPDPSESLALRDAVIEKIDKRNGYKKPNYQSDMFLIDDVIREAVRLGIVVPLTEAFKEDFSE